MATNFTLMPIMSVLVFVIAGREGIEPSLAVLETAVLPLNDRPLLSKLS